MDIVARYNIQRGKKPTVFQRANADYSFNGDYLDSWILQHTEMKEALIINPAEYKAFIDNAAADIETALEDILNGLK